MYLIRSWFFLRERLKMGRVIGRCVAPSSFLARVTQLSCPLMLAVKVLTYPW